MKPRNKMPSSASVLLATAFLLVASTGNPPSLHAQEAILRLKPAPGPLNNPLKGWCPFTDAGDLHQPYSMVFSYVSWRALEPQPGQYQFDDWEKTWEHSLAAGKHIVFRVYIDYPQQPAGLPDWLRAAGVQETRYEDHGGGVSPDYDDPRLETALEKLISALGKRYNQNPRIAFIQLGLLGHWGEWHTWPNDTMYASPQTEQRIIDAYHKAFPDKMLMVRYARDYAGQQPWIGFHDDLFPQDTDNGEEWSFLNGLRSTGRTDNWQKAVVGGEMVPGEAQHWLLEDLGTTRSRLERGHFTWVGPYCPALDGTDSEEFHLRSQELVRQMGYEFQLNEVRYSASIKPHATIRLALSGQNQGVAPFYYPWDVELAILAKDGSLVLKQRLPWDIRAWQPGAFSEAAEITHRLQAGSYQLALGVRDPWLDKPAIRFANELTVSNGWTILGPLEVK